MRPNSAETLEGLRQLSAKTMLVLGNTMAAQKKSSIEKEGAVQLRHAFFIKLGKGGKWEKDSVEHGLMRIGWRQISVSDINAGNWNDIECRIRSDMADSGAAKRDFNALREVVTSTQEDVWITFYAGCLWWCRLAPGAVEEDATSKFRRTAGDWSDRDVGGGLLLTANIPGVLSQLQGFRGTVCKVREASRLRSLLSAEPSAAHQAVAHARAALIHEVRASLGGLHWKDFETLVDLLFRQAGWRRLSVLGETMKFADLELEEPINHERYQVQIKATADLGDFTKYRDQFAGRGFRKLFFIVHSPSPNLAGEPSSAAVELVLPERLSEMVVDGGLVSWLLAKVR